ncbi:MAG: hypothetical protein M9958_07130 [Chitinophagales bacterium]|nr:hypothetical protein [Chitinophagales bacterium]
MMKKLFKIQYGILAFILLFGACKKDTPEKSDIPKEGDRDIRITKVQYSHDNGGGLVKSDIYYRYDESGQLSDILTDSLNSVASIEYDNGQIKIGTRNYEFPGYPDIRPYTTIVGKDLIVNIKVNVPRIIPWSSLISQDLSRVNISRLSNGMLNSILLDSTFGNGNTVSPSEARKLNYRSLNMRMQSYNSYGLPDRIESVKGINDIGFEDLKGTPFEDWNDIPYEDLYRKVIVNQVYTGRDRLFKDLFEKFGLNYYVNPAPILIPDDKANQLLEALELGPVKFSFHYIKADDVPTKLKRLVNEELLYLNSRYGVMNLNTRKLYYGDASQWKSEYGSGEGNWLISFGIPQYYILEEKSTHLVSQRTTEFYHTDMYGNTEYLKTKVEDFSYKHDAEAKTLEIAGLKIWYEYVE